MSLRITPVVYRDLQYLSHPQIKALLQTFRDVHHEQVDITNNWRHNQSLLVDMLNRYSYDKRIGLTYTMIHDEISTPDVVIHPKKKKPVEPGNEPGSVPGKGEARNFVLEPGNEPQFQDFYEERRGQDDSEDELYNLIEQRKAIDDRIKELQQREEENDNFINDLMNVPASKGPVQRSHDERFENYSFTNALMNVPASDGPVQRTHEERYRDYTLETTNGILNGDINRELNAELTKFIDKHPFAHIECDDAIILFPPLNMEAFKAALRRVSYHPNSIKKEDHNVYLNYYLNKITDLNFIFTSLDTIYDENKAHPFKIGFDCGFVVEDTKDATYKRTAPSEDSVGKTIPVTITNRSDMETYKHYVFSAISEKAERTHEHSSQHYCAIHTILFKVTRLGLSGARITIPGYDFLAKNRYIVTSPNDFNLCMFCALAEAKSRVKN